MHGSTRGKTCRGEKLQQKGGTSLQRLLLWMRELVMEPNGDGQDQRMGNKDEEEALIRFWKKDDETLLGCCTRTASTARTIWKQLKLPFLSEAIAGSMWRAMGWICDQRPNAVLQSLKQFFAWRSMVWWKIRKPLNMMVDPNNHTRWKHTWEWHHRGSVLDKLASEWSGAEEWMEKRKDVGTRWTSRNS